MRALLTLALVALPQLAAAQIEIFVFEHVSWSQPHTAQRDDGPEAEVAPMRDLRFGLAVGWALTDHVQIEGLWQRQSFEARVGRGNETRVEGLHLTATVWLADLIYAFGAKDYHGLSVRPYAVLGAGVAQITHANGEYTSPIALGGLGLKALLTPHLGFRVDARVMPLKVAEAEPTRAAGRSTNAGYNSVSTSRKPQLMVVLGVTVAF